MTASLAFIDTETTGLDPDRHEIWEVAVILRPGTAAHAHSDRPMDYPDEEIVWQLPVDLGRADPIALNIGRFHERRKDSTQLVTPADFSEEFVEMTRSAHLVGAVISFDAERLWRLLRANGQCPMWHYHLIDVEALAAGYIAGRPGDAGGTPNHEPPWKSEDLSHAVGVNPDDFDRHTALGDAQWARAIYDAVNGSST